MTQPAQQPENPADVLFICSLEDLNCLHDYVVAAMAGDDLSEIPRLWNQQIGVIRSRPNTSTPSNDIKPEPKCFGNYADVSFDDGRCVQCSEWGYCADVTNQIQKRTPAIRNATLDELKELLSEHGEDEWDDSYMRGISMASNLIESLRTKQEPPK